MTIDGDVLEVELDMELKDVQELKEFVETRLEYIEEVKVVGELDAFSTASLLQLLHSMKVSKPSLAIKVIEEGLNLNQFGLIDWQNSRK